MFCCSDMDAVLFDSQRPCKSDRHHLRDPTKGVQDCNVVMPTIWCY